MPVKNDTVKKILSKVLGETFSRDRTRNGALWPVMV